MKRSFAVFALLGLVGCFLPLIPGFSLFDARHHDWLGVMLVIGAFAVPMVLGFSDKLMPAAAFIALGCFGWLLYRFGFDTLDLIWHGSIGAKAMGIGALGGFVTSLGAFDDTKH